MGKKRGKVRQVGEHSGGTQWDEWGSFFFWRESMGGCVLGDVIERRDCES